MVTRALCGHFLPRYMQRSKWLKPLKYRKDHDDGPDSGPGACFCSTPLFYPGAQPFCSIAQGAACIDVS